MSHPPLAKALVALANHFFPGHCLNCGLPSRRAIDLCHGCELSLPALACHCSVCAEPLTHPGICGHCLKSPPDFFRVVAPYEYRPPLDGWILGLKHRGELRAGRTLGWLLADHLLSHREQLFWPDCLVPVPLHWRRRLGRGFNQAQEIARMISLRTGLPICRDLAHRARPTDHQQALTREQRARNMRRAFEATPEAEGRHIAIIDDVVTTASTARALSTALINAGARSVQVWAVARTALEK